MPLAPATLTSSPATAVVADRAPTELPVMDRNSRFMPCSFLLCGYADPVRAGERVGSLLRQTTRGLVPLRPWMKSSRAPLPKARGSVYLFDTKGRLRRVHSGEGEYAETERAIRSLLGRRSFPALCR